MKEFINSIRFYHIIIILSSPFVVYMIIWLRGLLFNRDKYENTKIAKLGAIIAIPLAIIIYIIRYFLA